MNTTQFLIITLFNSLFNTFSMIEWYLCGFHWIMCFIFYLVELIFKIVKSIRILINDNVLKTMCQKMCWQCFSFLISYLACLKSWWENYFHRDFKYILFLFLFSYHIINIYVLSITYFSFIFLYLNVCIYIYIYWNIGV